jgi:hypothetical protein
MKNQIVEYIRHLQSNQKIGVMVAGVDEKDGHLKVGYSVLHKLDYGKFDCEKGMKIALGRALKYGTPEIEEAPGISPVPYKIRRNLGRFAARCEKYYKDKTLPVWLQFKLVTKTEK